MQVRVKRDCVVDGLGKLTADDWVDITPQQEAKFELYHGKPLMETNSAVMEVREKPVEKLAEKTVVKPRIKKEDS